MARIERTLFTLRPVLAVATGLASVTLALREQCQRLVESIPAPSRIE